MQWRKWQKCRKISRGLAIQIGFKLNAESGPLESGHFGENDDFGEIGDFGQNGKFSKNGEFGTNARYIIQTTTASLGN